MHLRIHIGCAVLMNSHTRTGGRRVSTAAIFLHQEKFGGGGARPSILYKRHPDFQNYGRRSSATRSAGIIWSRPALDVLVRNRERTRMTGGLWDAESRAIS